MASSTRRGPDIGEPELAAPDQPQRAVAGNVAPGEKEVTVGAVAAHVRPAEVEAVFIAPHGDRYLPARRGRITGHLLDGEPGLARYGQRGPVVLILSCANAGPDRLSAVTVALAVVAYALKAEGRVRSPSRRAVTVKGPPATGSSASIRRTTPGNPFAYRPCSDLTTG